MCNIEVVYMPMIHDPKTGTSGRIRQLDYHKAFTYWLEFGTLKKATMAMENDGYVLTTKSGVEKPFSYWTIQAGAWMWVIEHPDEALAVWQSKGYFPDGKDEAWKKWISSKIRRYVRSNNAKDRALEINGIKDWYYGKENSKGK